MELKSKLLNCGLFVVIASFAFSACSENELDEREVILSKEYQLVEVTWGKMAEDKTECRTFEQNQEVVARKEGTKYSATVYDMLDYEQSSQFFSDDRELFMHLLGDDSYTLSVPSEDFTLTDNINLHISGGIKMPFALDVYRFDTNDNSHQKSTSEAPFKLESKSIIEEYHVTATYRACFKEVDGNRTVEVIGKWKGVYYRCKHHVCTVLPL